MTLPDRFAAISDIHGNADALDAVLADAGRLGIAAVVNLGDSTGGPLWNARTVETLRARAIPTVRGNHDRCVIDPPGGRHSRWDAWAHEELTGERQQASRDWLAALPPVLALGDVLLCHATPGDDLTYWLHEAGRGRMIPRPLSAVEALAGPLGAALILCGHTHQQGAARLSDGRLVVNPGAVGSPAYADDLPEPHVSEAGTPDARYAVLTRGAAGWAVEFRLVPYDPAAAIARARARGAEDWVRPLALGRV
ncbi:metallophosphoesterase family protein [Frigidibacter sp. MR17.24]|uniref:metallophosphoesterase family protein n=1 Tax=Frigidibacter sp. MR17.24 TaxID=3127345 RepID=UPI0030130508